MKRERLTMGAVLKASTLVARERKPYDPTNVREFTFPDGREISIHRHSVRFATPFKDNPEHTLVAVKEGKNPMPLKITYADFMLWWKGSPT